MIIVVHLPVAIDDVDHNNQVFMHGGEDVPLDETQQIRLYLGLRMRPAVSLNVVGVREIPPSVVKVVCTIRFVRFGLSDDPLLDNEALNGLRHLGEKQAHAIGPNPELAPRNVLRLEPRLSVLVAAKSEARREGS